jgi:hypothetical protein
MNEEIKQKWVAALRSGKYPQTQETLQAEDGFCCLGVLCEVMELPKEYSAPVERSYYFFNNKGMEKELSVEFLKYVGLTTPQESELIDLNDVAHYSFSEIADYIEENY